MIVGKTKALFIDTNGFLQVRDLKDVPWKELFPDVHAIDVLIAPPVIEELDKHKTGTNQRRRDRARHALRLIDQASAQPEFALVLREKPIRVRIVVSTAPSLNWTNHPNLDPSRPDDQLVAEALSFGNGAAIFSHDTGPRIRARIAGLDAHQPPEEWLLPLEQTDDQRKITKLERDLEDSLRRFPNIIAGFDNFDERTSEIRLVAPILRPIDPQLAGRLANEYLERHPRAQLMLGSNNMLWQLGATSESEANRYHASYSAFQDKVRAYYADLHKRIRRIGASPAIGYFVKNTSGVAADGLRIEFDLDGNADLLADREPFFGRGMFEMPKPPEEPNSLAHYRHMLPRISTLRDVIEPRDPVSFYWFDRPSSGGKHSALQCQEFRATRSFHDHMIVAPRDNLATGLSVRMHISAANLPQPINLAAKITITEQEVEWTDSVVQTILPESLGKLFRSP